MLVEMLVAELAVEALNVAVLHRAPGLDQDVADGFPSTVREITYSKPNNKKANPCEVG